MNEDEETWIVVNQASRLDKLITPLQIHVASYLSYQEASAFCCASRDCPKMRSVDVELEETASDFNNHPSSGYAAFVWQSFEFPPSSSRHLIHHCTIDASWKDQGWGNRKGMLSVVKDGGVAPGDSCPSGSDVVASKQPAPHKWEPIQLTFTCNPESSYRLWVRIGGGGGHALFFRSTTVTAYEFIVD
ncbi:hypothetical protein TrLO_g9905 [Triparma laevis f. longispina]|uniref:Uncharacterized protein n=1 Tax=Triparma laevis f. longispina TaxID=1714387 RepID=A0A9W6ZW86_9STRA|nr:hypothetical protein TrLO_g9905 [Triparma laevis f. longispina]